MSGQTPTALAGRSLSASQPRFAACANVTAGDACVSRAVVTTPVRLPAFSACVRMEGISFPICDAQSSSVVFWFAAMTSLFVFSPHNIAVAVAAESGV